MVSEDEIIQTAAVSFARKALAQLAAPDVYDLDDVLYDEAQQRDHGGLLGALQASAEEAWPVRQASAHLTSIHTHLTAALTWWANCPTPAAADVLAEVGQERHRQDARWGQQDHPDGTGQAWPWVGRAFAQHRLVAPTDVFRDWARLRCQIAADEGALTWEHILTEEWAEAYAEDDPTALRAELIQVAAVACAWIEALDRRLGQSARGHLAAKEL